MAQGISGIWAVAALGVSPGLEQMTLESRAVECMFNEVEGLV